MITHGVRNHVIERARDCCEYCLSQRRFSPAPFSIEHIVPHSRGGTSDAANLALACQGCNNHKFTRVSGTDPVSLREVGFYNPRVDLWSEHFGWSDDFIELIGLTACGRATIAALRLNRSELAALRRVLVAARLHPPDYRYWRVNS